MLATFEGRIEKGQLLIKELENSTKILEEKSIAVASLEANAKGILESGELIAGVYRNGRLEVVGKGNLKKFEGKQVYVVVRHELFINHEAFDQKFQLGSKVGDIDR